MQRYILCEEPLEVISSLCISSTVIPAMVQRLFFFYIIKLRDHKYATPPRKQFYVFLATAPTGVLTAGTAGLL